MHVRIYQPSRSAMQSGKGKTHHWVIEFDSEDAPRAEPLMGWTSLSDTRHQLTLKFASSEEALAYAQSQGWQATVVQSAVPAPKPKLSYSENFSPERFGSWTH